MKRIISILICTVLMLQFPIFAYGEENLAKCLANNPYHILINKQVSLSKDYKPSNLVMPNVRFASPGNLEKNYMEYNAAKALEKMFDEAKQQKIRLTAVSGYRSYSRQEQLYKAAVAKEGVNQRGTAKPGESEHQTGLAMDINSISQSFGNTKEGIWLAQNAHKYGFIIRYPKGKEHITGYMYEPWHIRYVGNELAEYCYTHQVALEEVEYCCMNEREVHIEMTAKSGKAVTHKTYQLIEQAGTTYIKAKDLAECTGGYAAFEKGVLTFYLDGMKLAMQKGITSMNLDHAVSKISSPLMSINGSMYVPIRSTLSQLGYSVSYTEGKIIIK